MADVNMIFLFLAFGVATASSALRRFQNLESWTKQTHFNPIPLNIDTMCSTSEVGAILARVSKAKGVLYSDGSHSNNWNEVKWHGEIDRQTESIVEARIIIKAINFGFSNLGTGSSREDKWVIWLRWIIDTKVAQGKILPTRVSAEWSSTSKNLSRSAVQDVLSNLFSECRSEITKRGIEFTTGNGNVVVVQGTSAISQVNQTVAIAAPPLTSQKQIGSVTLPKRKYTKIKIDQAVEIIEQVVTKGGDLLDPIGGQMHLRWQASTNTHRTLPNTTEETVKFTEYGAENGPLTDELVIRWQFTQDARTGEIELTTYWSGPFQVSSGDIIRHLMDRAETALTLAGARSQQSSLQSRVYQASSSRTATRWDRPDQDYWTSQQRNIKTTKQFWPTPQDYNETIQNPHLCFADEELQESEVELTPLGLPKVSTGSFASVYKVRCKGVDWAVRCFSAQVKDQEDRYEKTSRFVCGDDLPYTVPLQYMKEGIRIQGKWFPILKMEWVEGTPLYEYVDLNYQKSDKMHELQNRFLTMMTDLKHTGIAHSDLQHGNVIIRNDEIVLVDYDGMFVPELSGYLSNERGHPNYQHPSREARHFGPYLDNFSAFLIDTALLSIIHDPDLWTKFSGDGESMLFHRRDLEQPNGSEIFATLKQHPVSAIRERAEFILTLLESKLEQVPYLQSGCPDLLVPQTDNVPEKQSESSTTPKQSGLPDWMK